jgi:hypothetical protein
MSEPRINDSVRQFCDNLLCHSEPSLREGEKSLIKSKQRLGLGKRTNLDRFLLFFQRTSR